MRPVAELVARYGSPLYVYDLDRVATARRDLFAALPDGVEVYYSLKANPHPALARALREPENPGAPDRRTCRAEVSSTGELAAATEAGFDAADVLYTGPGKTERELRTAIATGVRMFSVESESDLRRVGAVAATHGVVADCLLRVNSAGTGGSTAIRMTGTPSQFGFDSETLPDALPALRRIPGTRLAGQHLFSLSNAGDEASLIAEFRHTVSMAAQLGRQLDLPMRLLDIGGGFAAPYLSTGDRPRYPRLRGALTELLDEYFPDWRSGRPRVACESGRHLVGDSGRLVCTVVNVKVSRGQRFVILDAGINVLGGMSGLGRLLPVSVDVDATELSGARPPWETATLVGPLCTPGDILGRSVPVPALAPGDLVTIPNAGAYGVTASLLMFLGRPAPVEVFVRRDDVVTASRVEFHRTSVPATVDRRPNDLERTP